MAAIFGGYFIIEGACLVFRTEAETYLPVFNEQASVELRGDVLKIGERSVKLGTNVEIGGGERSAAANDLVTPAPKGCDLRRIYIGS